MRILVCDDDIIFVNNIKYYIKKYLDCRGLHYKIDVSNNPCEIMQSDIIYQLVLLNIKMKKIDGISLAKELKKRNSHLVIFFITSLNMYQDDAMDLMPFRFFKKPIEPKRLYAGLDRAIEYIDETYIDFYSYFNNSLNKVKINEVVYVERTNRQVILNTVNGSYSTRESFEYWTNNLQNSFFFKVHKSFIINLHFITNYKYTEVMLENNIRISIATRRQAEFHKFWLDYLKRRYNK